MPQEHDFMKSAKEKEMPEEEYLTLREEYDKKAEKLSGRIKKTLFTFLGMYAVSFVIIYLFSTFRTPSISEITYIWLAVEFLLIIFIYDPTTEADKKLSYETDKRLLLVAVKGKITSYKIKFGLVIGFGVLFVILNIVWWMIFGSMDTGEMVSELRGFIYNR